MISNEWEKTKLGKLCDVIAGQSPQSKFYNKSKDGLPFYQGKKEFTNKYIGKSEIYTSNITKIALPNDILMSVRAPVGPINYAVEKCCIGRGLAAIRVKEGVLSDFIYYFLLSKQDYITGHEGTTFNSISRNEIEDLNIIFPPMEKQKRIAAKLDDAFQKIEALENNTKENIKNIEDLYNSYLNKIFTENTDDWEEKIFDKVCNIYTGNSINANIKKQKYSNLDNGYNYIATKDISFSNVINYENGIKIPKDEDKFKIAPKNSILLCIEGGSAGRKIGILKEDVCFVNKLCAFVIKYKYLNYMFVYYYLQSPKFKQIFYDNKTGLIGGVSLNKLKKLTIAFPKIEEQKKIVDKLDIFNNKIQTIKQNYQNKINLLDNLKKSILNKAFKGEV